MNYELAKQLRDAGFEHNVCCETCKYPDVCEGIYLEELIEACGKGFHAVTKFNQSPNNGKWKASYAGEFSGETTYQGRGSTPTEAVAKLWLALNNKTL